MATLKLLSFPGDFRALKALVAAQYNGVSIDTPKFEVGTDNTTPEFLEKSPAGKVPVLETPKGAIFESNAIARYVARLRRDTDLCGVSFFESGQVDSWVDFCSHELELPATLWVYPIFGFLDYRPQIAKKASEDLMRALDVLEAHLMSRSFLVGNKVTLADIVCTCALLYPMKMVLDEEIRAKYTCVTRWFLTCVNQPEFAAVLGDVPLCREALHPAAAQGAKGEKKGKGKGKGKQQQQQGGKKGGKKADTAAKPAAKAAPAPAPAPKKKKEGPFDHLPKSSMILDVWKKTYSNARSDYYASMPKFYEQLDREGYSVWFCEYNYNSDNAIDFQTSNLVSGFVQRCDPLRRYAFGIMQILNESAPFEICGAWLLRGQEIGPMLETNPDAEYYTWTKMDLDNEDQRKRLADMWCSADKVDGKPIMDSKVFK